MPAYFAGFLAASVVLIARSPWFSFFCWIGFMHAARYLNGGWRYAGIAGTAVLVSVGQTGGFHTLSAPLVAVIAAISVLNAALVISFFYLGQKAEDQSTQRQKMIVELAEANRRLEAAMAENAGLHAQLLSQAREAGVLEERQRMAGEIHDTLAQGLTGIITQLEAAGSHGPAPQGAAASDTGDRAGPGEPVRGPPLGQALRPEQLEAPRLPEALAEVAGRWSERQRRGRRRSPPPATPVGLHAEIEVALFRVAQEALANVAKHAGGQPGRAHPVLHGGHGAAGRARRRRRLRQPGDGGAGDRTAASA